MCIQVLTHLNQIWMWRILKMCLPKSNCMVPIVIWLVQFVPLGPIWEFNRESEQFHLNVTINHCTKGLQHNHTQIYGTFRQQVKLDTKASRGHCLRSSILQKSLIFMCGSEDWENSEIGDSCCKNHWGIPLYSLIAINLGIYDDNKKIESWTEIDIQINRRIHWSTAVILLAVESENYLYWLNTVKAENVIISIRQI